MPIIANFKNSNLPTKDSVYLTVVSMDGEKQMGDSLGAFITLLNKPESRAIKLIIVVSGKLKEHYSRLNKTLTEKKLIQLSKEMDDKWINENQAALDHLHCECEILRWDQLLSKAKKEFKAFFDIVREDYYRKDEKFKNKVDQHSGSYYAEKLYVKLKKEIPDLTLDACKTAAINYVLEECAFLVLLHSLSDYLSYPGEMNPCFNHIYNKYFSEKKGCFQYQGYKLKTIKPKSMTRQGKLAQAMPSRYADRCPSGAGEAGNISRHKVIAKVTECSHEKDRTSQTQDELTSNFNHVMQPNFGDKTSKNFFQYNSYAVSKPLLTCKTGFFSDKEVSKRAVRFHILNTIKNLLNNASDEKVRVILESFDAWAIKLKNEEKPICINRKYSL